ncbi:MAG: tripartite tricarboxylate transporter substrate binding protein [Proteobacteria bacterium]|nr:tripartite tricarboxylate transporter substrate binding protein [Burkholderiales bacterium]
MIRMVMAMMIAGSCALPASAQTWPAKPVRLVIGFAAGGSVDLVARIVSSRLAETLAQPVIVETRPGAGGNIAGEVVARAPADGYAVLLSSGGALGGNLAIYTRMPYDPLKDLTPVAMVVYQSNVLIVNPSVPAKSVKEFIALARTRPGVLNYGSGGNGSSQHMSGELFSSMAGVKMVHVPYKGGAPAMVDLLGGQVDLMFQTIPEAIQMVRSGRVRALGLTGTRASAALVGVPTIGESGLPGFELEGWMGIAGPPGMPAAIVTRLNTDLNRILGEKDTRARITDAGLDIAGGSPEQMAAMMKDQVVRMVKLAKEAGIKPVD